MSSTQQNAPSLQLVNIANVIAYILYFAVSYGMMKAGYPDNAELSAKYQTLVTPAAYAFAIWGVIFLSQLIWVVVQVFPSYRSSDWVMVGVGYSFIGAYLAQSIWTIAFAAELISLSLLAMIAILIPLMMIFKRVSNMPHSSVAVYWLFKFPMEIHASWIMAATIVNFNVVFVAWDVSANTQVVWGWISLIVLAIVAFFYTLKEKWVASCVLAWASYAIKVELSNPKDSIVEKFSSQAIANVQMAAGGLAIAILVAIGAMLLYRRFLAPRSSSDSSYTQITDNN